MLILGGTRLYLIPFLHQTTTILLCISATPWLYLIPFLHQTTTEVIPNASAVCCILFHFYIKPQRIQRLYNRRYRCILFHFYIKPQREAGTNGAFRGCILFHFYIKPQRRCLHASQCASCILFHFYIKPQRRNYMKLKRPCCILFHFYIKPQRGKHPLWDLYVVSYSISTSNHNAVGAALSGCMLYLIPFLHQTTTRRRASARSERCILFHFYIKPQQESDCRRD